MSPQDIQSALERLGQLKDDGVLTGPEYSAIAARIVAPESDTPVEAAEPPPAASPSRPTLSAIGALLVMIATVAAVTFIYWHGRMPGPSTACAAPIPATAAPAAAAR